MDAPLNRKKCVPCEGGVPPLTVEKVNELLGHVQGWRSHGNLKIEKDYVFKNFKQALEFVNKAGSIAEEEGHHPDILLHNYKYVKITLSTHAIGGLSENDFILASKIDLL